MDSKIYEFSIEGAFDCLNEHGTEIGKMTTRIDQLQGMITKLSAQLNEKGLDQERKQDLLDEIIKDIESHLIRLNDHGADHLRNALHKLRYESIKYGMKYFHSEYDESDINRYLKDDSKEHWIVEDK